MFGLKGLLLFTLLVNAIFARPTRNPRLKRRFKLPRIEQHNYVPDGTFALRQAYRKFGIGKLDTFPGTTLTTKLTVANKQSAGGGNSTSTPQNEAQFLCPVTVGGQTLIMNIDSGSSDMWVFNTGMSESSLGGHTLYDPTKSTTAAEMVGSSFDISYGDGSFASGPVVTDSVDIGGATVDGQAIGVPDQVSQSFTEDKHSSGLVGLGFSKINTIKPEKQKTFFDNIMNDLAQPVFTASLKAGVAGAYEFGNIDTTQFQGELTTVPVDTSRGFWQFQSSQFTVGNGSTQSVTQGSGTAIADTGTSLMLMDDEIVNAYYANVKGAQNSQRVGGVIFDCDAVLPDLQVAVGDNYMAMVPGKNMNFARAPSESPDNTPACFGGVQSNQKAPIQIFGDVFFKAQFVAFNGADPPSLGLAPHV